jgi:hypothetical protein
VQAWAAAGTAASRCRAPLAARQKFDTCADGRMLFSSQSRRGRGTATAGFGPATRREIGRATFGAVPPVFFAYVFFVLRQGQTAARHAQTAFCALGSVPTIGRQNSLTACGTASPDHRDLTQGLKRSRNTSSIVISPKCTLKCSVFAFLSKDCYILYSSSSARLVSDKNGTHEPIELQT